MSIISTFVKLKNIFLLLSSENINKLINLTREESQPFFCVRMCILSINYRLIQNFTFENFFRLA